MNRNNHTQLTKSSKYVVIDEHTLGYRLERTPNFIGVLAGSVLRAGHSPLDGMVAIVPKVTRLRAATEIDFQFFRVALPTDFVWAGGNGERDRSESVAAAGPIQLAVTMAFLWQGFILSPELTRVELSDEEEGHYNGQIGAAQRDLSRWAVALDSILPIVGEYAFEYSGVFEYEVTERVGAYLRKMRCAMEDETIQEVAKTAAEFFLETGSDLYPEIKAKFAIALRKHLTVEF